MTMWGLILVGVMMLFALLAWVSRRRDDGAAFNHGDVVEFVVDGLHKGAKGRVEVATMHYILIDPIDPLMPEMVHAHDIRKVQPESETQTKDAH